MGLFKNRIMELSNRPQSTTQHKDFFPTGSEVQQQKPPQKNLFEQVICYGNACYELGKAGNEERFFKLLDQAFNALETITEEEPTERAEAEEISLRLLDYFDHLYTNGTKAKECPN